MADEPKAARGRPENKAITKPVTMQIDPATLNMLDALATHGRFGVTPPEVALSIIRLWLWDNESRLQNSVQATSKPFGIVIDGTKEE